jgi:hypothetical protein
MKFLITEEEREIIKKMHSLISEDTSVQVKNMVSQITSQIDNLENQFNRLETSGGKECDELKKSIVLVWSISSVMLKKILTSLVNISLESDLLKRMQIATESAENVNTILNAFNTLVDSASKK